MQQNRLHRPVASLRPSRASADSDAVPLPSGLRLFDTGTGGVDLSEILAAISAASPQEQPSRRRLLEDEIRKQWAVLRNLVREHAALVHAESAAAAADPVPAASVAALPPRAKSFIPPRRLAAAE
ncbi:hypothetical protein HHL28_13095 [Aerophototrophica crusticola]|uniref:Uncharacterized protein n=1 Tax=Aerophototrophica crusticola TaxID=1709002 RepID=A0A858R8X9_9PROT|nr:hypothetical protein HHL28_13095 [Rhodospirillaceae bacterium B3]